MLDMCKFAVILECALFSNDNYLTRKSVAFLKHLIKLFCNEIFLRVLKTLSILNDIRSMASSLHKSFHHLLILVFFAIRGYA